ncbi:MAG TPA: hypothetical protein VFR94_04290 [Nitrososphaeraceae archaeon]|nr:hypothetical protein [Nitrososphaeraceae archaeon]
MRASNIEYSSDNKKTIPLTEHDRSYGGHFLQDRDGIFHSEDDNGVAILVWENEKMQVRQYLETPLTGIWSLRKGQVCSWRFPLDWPRYYRSY